MVRLVWYHIFFADGLLPLKLADDSLGGSRNLTFGHATRRPEYDRTSKLQDIQRRYDLVSYFNANSSG